MKDKLKGVVRLSQEVRDKTTFCLRIEHGGPFNYRMSSYREVVKMHVQWLGQKRLIKACARSSSNLISLGDMRRATRLRSAACALVKPRGRVIDRQRKESGIGRKSERDREEGGTQSTRIIQVVVRK